MYLVQDIETIPETEVQDLWLKEEARLIEEGKPQRVPYIWAHKVICIGMLALDRDLKPVNGGCAMGGLQGGKTEKEMIERWSAIASGSFQPQDGATGESLRMVDWNGSKFDVPVLQTRAFHHGVPLPWLFALQPDNRGGISTWSKDYRDKYQGKHDDLSELWTNRGSFIKPTLASLAILMGLPGKMGIDGSKIYDAYKEKRYAEIDTYCMQDVIQTAFVFQRFRYMMGKLTLEQYREVATALLEWSGRQPGQGEFAKAIDQDALLIRPGVSSGNADTDHSGNDRLSTGSGSVPAGAPVQGAAGLRPEGSV